MFRVAVVASIATLAAVLVCAVQAESPPEHYPTQSLSSLSKYNTPGQPASVWASPRTPVAIAADSSRGQLITAQKVTYYQSFSTTYDVNIEALDIRTNKTNWRATNLTQYGCDGYTIQWIELVSRSLPPTETGTTTSPPNPDVVLVACDTSGASQLVTFNATNGAFISAAPLDRDIPVQTTTSTSIGVVPGDTGAIPRFAAAWTKGHDTIVYFATTSTSWMGDNSVTVAHITATGSVTSSHSIVCSGASASMLSFWAGPVQFASLDLPTFAFVAHCPSSLSLVSADGFFDTILTVQTRLSSAVITTQNANYPVMDAVTVYNETLVIANWNSTGNTTDIVAAVPYGTHLFYVTLLHFTSVPRHRSTASNYPTSGTPIQMNYLTRASDGTVILVIQMQEKRVVALKHEVPRGASTLPELVPIWMMDYPSLFDALYKADQMSPNFGSTLQETAATPVVYQDVFGGFYGFSLRINSVFLLLDAFTGDVVWMAGSERYTECSTATVLNNVLSVTHASLYNNQHVLIEYCSGFAFGINLMANPWTQKREFNVTFGFEQYGGVGGILPFGDMYVIEVSSQLMLTPASNFIWTQAVNSALLTVDRGVVYSLSTSSSTAVDQSGQTIWTQRNLGSSFTSVPPVVFGAYLLQATSQDVILALDIYTGNTVAAITTTSGTLTCGVGSWVYLNPFTVASGSAYTSIGNCLFAVTSALQLVNIPLLISTAATTTLQMAPFVVGRDPLSVTSRLPLLPNQQWMVYGTTDGQLIGVDVATKSLNWTTYADEVMTSGARINTVADGTVFCVTDYLSVTCRVSSNGKKLWRENFPASQTSPPQAFLLYDRVIVPALGFVWIYALAPDITGSRLIQSVSTAQYYGFCTAFSSTSAVPQSELSDFGILLVQQSSCVFGLRVNTSTAFVSWNISLGQQPNWNTVALPISIDPEDPRVALVTSTGTPAVVLDVVTGRFVYSVLPLSSMSTNYLSPTLSHRTIFTSSYYQVTGYALASTSTALGDLFPSNAGAVLIAPVNVTIPPGYVSPTQAPETTPPLGPVDYRGPAALPQTEWAVTFPNYVSTFTVPIDLDNAVIVAVPYYARNISAFNASSGALLWFTQGTGLCASTSYTVWVTGTFVNATNANLTSAVVVLVCSTDVFGYDALTGTLLWQHREFNGVSISSPSPVALDGVIAYTTSGQIVARAIATGAEVLSLSKTGVISLQLAPAASGAERILLFTTSTTIDFSYSEQHIFAYELPLDGSYGVHRWTVDVKTASYVSSATAVLPGMGQVLIVTGKQYYYYADDYGFNITIVNQTNGHVVHHRHFNSTELPNVSSIPQIFTVPAAIRTGGTGGVSFVLASQYGFAGYEYDPATPMAGRVAWSYNMSAFPQASCTAANGNCYFSSGLIGLAGGVPSFFVLTNMYGSTSFVRVYTMATFKLATGDVTWMNPVDQDYSSNTVASSMAQDLRHEPNHIVAVLGGGIYGFNAQDGSKLWSAAFTMSTFALTFADGGIAPRRVVVGTSAGYGMNVQAIVTSGASSDSVSWTAYADSPTQEVEVVFEYSGLTILINEPLIVARDTQTGVAVWHTYLPGTAFTLGPALQLMGTSVAVRRSDRILVFNTANGTLQASIMNVKLFELCASTAFNNAIFAVLTPGYVTDIEVGTTPHQPSGGHNATEHIMMITAGTCIYFLNSNLQVYTLPYQENAAGISFARSISMTSSPTGNGYVVVFGASGHLRGVALSHDFVTASSSNLLNPVVAKWLILNDDLDASAVAMASQGSFVFVTTRYRLWCIEAESGQVAWQEPLDYSWSTPYNEIIVMPPVVVSNQVIVFRAYSIVAIDVSYPNVANVNYTGSRLIWVYNQQVSWAAQFTRRPVVIADRIVVAALPSYNQLVRFNVSEGYLNTPAAMNFSTYINAGNSLQIRECVSRSGQVRTAMVVGSTAAVYDLLTWENLGVAGLPSSQTSYFTAMCYVQPSAAKATVAVAMSGTKSSNGVIPMKGSVYLRVFSNAYRWFAPVPSTPPQAPTPNVTLPPAYSYPFPLPTEPLTNAPMSGATQSNSAVPAWSYYFPVSERNIIVLPTIAVVRELYNSTGFSSAVVSGFSATSTGARVWTRDFGSHECASSYYADIRVSYALGGPYVAVACSYSVDHFFLLDAYTGVTVARANVTNGTYALSDLNRPLYFASPLHVVCAQINSASTGISTVQCTTTNQASQHHTLTYNCNGSGIFEFVRSSDTSNLLVVMCPNTIVAFHPATGAQAWEFSIPSPASAPTSNTWCPGPYVYAYASPSAAPWMPEYQTVHAAALLACNNTDNFAYLTMVHFTNGHSFSATLNYSTIAPYTSSTLSRLVAGYQPNSCTVTYLASGIVTTFLMTASLLPFEQHANGPTRDLAPAWTVYDYFGDSFSTATLPSFLLATAEAALIEQQSGYGITLINVTTGATFWTIAHTTIAITLHQPTCLCPRPRRTRICISQRRILAT
jgi:hypothetical protein